MAVAIVADKVNMFEWDESLSVQINGIDGQHQNLFKMARELHTAALAGMTKPKMGEVLDRLVRYTEVHFGYEERLMQEFSYPDYAAHKVEHEDLKRRVLQFQTDFAAGQPDVTMRLLRFFKDWLVKHIADSDRKYAPYVQQKIAV